MFNYKKEEEEEDDCVGLWTRRELSTQIPGQHVTDHSRDPAGEPSTAGLALEEPRDKAAYFSASPE